MSDPRMQHLETYGLLDRTFLAMVKADIEQADSRFTDEER